MERAKDICLLNSLVVLQFSLFASPQAENDFLARPPLWKAIENVNFTDFVQRTANVIIQLSEFYLATSYKMYSVTSQTKYGNFS